MSAEARRTAEYVAVMNALSAWRRSTNAELQDVQFAFVAVRLADFCETCFDNGESGDPRRYPHCHTDEGANEGTYGYHCHVCGNEWQRRWPDSQLNRWRLGDRPK